MKKIKIAVPFLMFVSLSMVAFSPNGKLAAYKDLSHSGTAEILNEEVGSFQEAETSHTTADKTVWSKRHKTWTDLTSTNSVNEIQQVIERN